MNWEIAILVQTVLVALSIICMRVLARDKRTAKASFAISGGSYVAQYAAMLALVPFFGDVHSEVVSHYWWRFLLGGLAFALFGVCTYKTLTYFDVAIANIVASVNAIFAVVGALLFLSEKLSPQQLLGGVILLLGVGYGLLATHATHKKAVRKKVLAGGMYAVAAGLFFAVAAINEKSLLSVMPIGSYMIFGVGAQVLVSVSLAVIFQPKKLVLLLRPHVAGWTALFGALRGLGGACFIVAEVRSNNVGLVSVIANFRLMIVVLLGAWLLQEHKHLKEKSVAAAASLAGIAVMFWK